MLLEIAIGDAYGAGFEFTDAAHVAAHNHLLGYVRNPAYPALLPGRYTDDTQMSLAVSEWLLDGRATAEDLADRFVLAYRRDPRPGYSRGLQAVLDDPGCVDGRALRSRLHGGSEKVGAAMRAVPLGLLPDRAGVVRACRLQAEVTHTGAGVAAAVAVALSAHYAYQSLGPRANLLGYAADPGPGAAADAREGGLFIAWSSLSLVAEERSLAALLRRCVALGGDTDSAAAIALGVAALFSDTVHDLPAVLLTGLEAGPYGAGYLRALDAQLHEAFPRRT
jgi:ADP-ribosyl-[dinitrogen reductase] hydrolase